MGCRAAAEAAAREAKRARGTGPTMRGTRRFKVVYPALLCRDGAIYFEIAVCLTLLLRQNAEAPGATYQSTAGRRD